jgi:hypothetical protein
MLERQIANKKIKKPQQKLVNEALRFKQKYKETEYKKYCKQVYKLDNIFLKDIINDQ